MHAQIQLLYGIALTQNIIRMRCNNVERTVSLFRQWLAHRQGWSVLGRSSIPETKRRRVHSLVTSEASPVIQKAWPRLQAQFRQHANPQGDFPLLSLQQQERIQKSGVAQTPERQNRQAAVLVLLCSISGIPSIIFTRRAAHLNKHAAEMAFCGGHFEAGVDRDLVDTALREAEEELVPSLNTFPNFRSHIQVLGKSTPLPSLHGTPVTPVLAVLWPDVKENTIEEIFPGDPTEVDLVLAVSLQDLIDGETKQEIDQQGVRLPDAPVYPTPHGDIWGLTAYILKPLMRKLFKPAFELTTTATK